ncbi:MAG: UDP-3-O-(3-hydroxymyristoyl)glucosamine N-acyltransferase [Holosporales bacterium]|jgi:UDP-3-O-[3-hydroxymyristoyl] glucosamine N-acyltransferase|nr:UDP-3-O-(3-hydroxymyristoyl)glucosamine N-acyltransferase [Holosporales bacterium]
MIDKRFYRESIPHTASQLAEACEASLEPFGKDCLLSDIATLEKAAPTDLSFFSNAKYLKDLKNTQAGAVFVPPQYIQEIPSHVLALVTPHVLPAYGHAAALLYPSCRQLAHIHPTASIDPTACIGEDISIGPYSVIQAYVKIGSGTTLGAHTTVQEGVIIGKRCQIANNVTLSYALIGDDVRIHAGARIGEPGFGTIPGHKGMVFIPQLGRVLIGNRVRIGANTTIDRGSVEDTVIGEGTIIDNLVQIAHNVHIGKNCVLVAQVGLAGSCSLGDQVVLAGKVGVAGHVHIGSNVTAAAKTGITNDVTDGKIIAGFPAEEVSIWRRQVAILRKLTRKQEKREEA